MRSGVKPRRIRSMAVAAMALCGLIAVMPMAPVSGVSAVGGTGPAPGPGPTPALRYFCGNSGTPTVTGGPGAGYRVTTPSGLDFGLDDVSRGWWRTPPRGMDLVQALHFYSQSWLWKVAVTAHRSGDQATVDRAVGLALTSLKVHPDTGRPDDAQWNEGANLWRQDAVTCLYWLTGDERLVPVVEAAVRANLDPVRYYGPPKRPPHNHGLMANQALLLSAYVLGRPEWRAAAVNRLWATARRWVTPSGLGVEQSAAYHQTNVALWKATLRLLALGGRPGAIEHVIESTVARAEVGLGALVMPDLMLVPYGDGVGGPQPMPTSGRGVLVDPVAGVVAGRWSFAAPDDYYLVRYGPPRYAHGHFEHGEVVWWARGRPVTADPGIATKVPGPSLSWQMSPAAHSVALLPRARFDPRGMLRLAHAQSSGPVHRYVFSGGLWHRTQTRTVVIDSRRDQLTIHDLARVPQMQVLQLDARWVPNAVSGNRRHLTFVDGSGGRLILSTTGHVVSVRRGTRGLAGGWMLRMFAAPTPAARVLIAAGPAVTTRLVVEGPALSPWRAEEASMPPAGARTALALALAGES